MFRNEARALTSPLPTYNKARIQKHNRYTEVRTAEHENCWPRSHSEPQAFVVDTKLSDFQPAWLFSSGQDPPRDSTQPTMAATDEPVAYPTVYGLWTNKGGVGKTTLTFNLACSYAHLFPDHYVVAIDMCPQSNLSSTMLTYTRGKCHEQLCASSLCLRQSETAWCTRLEKCMYSYHSIHATAIQLASCLASCVDVASCISQTDQVCRCIPLLCRIRSRPSRHRNQ